MNFSTSLTVSETPNYGSNFARSEDILSGFGAVPSGVVFAKGSDGLQHVFIFPSIWNTNSNLPGLEFVQITKNTFNLLRFLPDVSMNAARDWKILSQLDLNSSSFVVVDHGAEVGSDWRQWPHGYLWLAVDSGDGFEFQKISDTRAFNHSVAVGDLSADLLDDIVVSNMGYKAEGIQRNLHGFLNEGDNIFQQLDFFSSGANGLNSGAVTISDLNNDGVNEVVQASYLSDGSSADDTALWIISGSIQTGFNRVATLSREGLFKTMGATQVVSADLDLDGDLDLVVSLEGNFDGDSSKYTGTGIEIYKNEGEFQFQRVTPEYLPTNSWRSETLQYRELAVTDADGDGYLDIVLQGWNGTAIYDGKSVNLGSLYLRNLNGDMFASQNLSEGVTVSLSDSSLGPQYLRFLDSQDGAVRFFSVGRLGQPEIYELYAAYRDAAEDIVVEGVSPRLLGLGGNDLFRMQARNAEVDGGDGLDTAIYRGKLSEYVLKSEDSVWDGRLGDGTLVKGHSVQDTVQSRDGKDFLTEVERLTFSDKSIALDVGATENAGKAKLFTGAIAHSLSNDAATLGTILNFVDNGYSDLTSLSQLAISVGLVSKLAGGDSNEALADLVTKNLLGQANPLVATMLTSYMDGTVATYSQAQFLAAVAALEVNQQHVDLVGLAQTGMEYVPVAL